MGLTRLLALAALAFLAYLAWIRVRAWLDAGEQGEKRKIAGGHMVRCRRCGLFVPENDAVRDSRGRTYCSREHRDASAGDDSA